MKKIDFQPLLDKVLYRFNSWTVRHLSFAGRFQLIQSVIYSTIAFWASIFIIPKECIKLLEQMCNAFLWRGAPTAARGVKISWISVCTPKKEGGLGLRRLEEWNQVLGLKLIWLIFAAGGSLWVFWVRSHLIREKIFWELQPERSNSWIWKSLCNLRHIARPMIICQIGNGASASFWNENWTSLGPLIDITGPRGPEVTGLHGDAVVAEALREDNWWVNRSRSRNMLISLVRDCLPEAGPIISSEADIATYGSQVKELLPALSLLWILGQLCILRGSQCSGTGKFGYMGGYRNTPLLLGLLLETDWEREIDCGVGNFRCRQIAFYATWQMRRGNTSSLSVVTTLKCGIFSARDWIFTLLSCLKMVWDGSGTRLLMSLWSW